MANPEKQNENPDEKKFEKEFEDEMGKGGENFDKKAFGEIVSGAKFDENISKEENFKNAFNSKVDGMIKDNLKNLPNEKIEELKSLQKKSNEGKNSQELIESYKEIKETLGTRHAESKKGEIDKQNQDNTQIKEKTSKESQDFVDKLLEAIKESQERERKTNEERRNEQRKLAQEQKGELEIAEAGIEKLESPTAQS